MATDRPVIVRIRGKVTREWRAAATGGGRLLMFSPYVTNPTARQVLAVAAGKCELYTVLDPMNFATGASSLSALKDLARAGVKLFRLDALHAKLMLAPGRLLTVGSQNLTLMGASAKRLEATAIVTDPQVIKKAEEDIKIWVATSRPVTEQMLVELGVAVRKLKVQVQKIRREADDAIEKVIANQEARDKIETDRRLTPKPHQRSGLIDATLDKLRSNSNSVLCKIHSNRAGLLTTRCGDRFDQLWRRSGDRLNRFICFDARSMRWGWARIGSGRISRINQGISCYEPLNYQRRPIKISVESLRVESPTEPNLAIEIKYLKHIVCRLKGILLLDRIVIDSVEPTQSVYANEFDFTNVMYEVAENSNDLQGSLLKAFAHPFEYAAGARLAGWSPRLMIGPGKYVAWLSDIGGYPTVIIADY